MKRALACGAFIAGYGLLSTVNAIAALTSAQTITVNAKPTSVTVFVDRAQVVRSMSRILQKGKYTLIFDNLPYRVSQNSVQLGGSSTATLLDVKFKKKHYISIPDHKLRDLNLQKTKLADLLIDISDKIKQTESEKSFVEKIIVRLTTVGQKAPQAQLDPAKWVKMVSFYRKKISSLDKEMRLAQRDKRQHQNKLDKLQREISQLGSQQHKTRNQVHATILVNKSGPVSLDMSYIVYGPSWKPSYDLRVLSNKKTMKVSYNAVIRQNTGENWNDVKVMLSTAQVNVNGQQPSLSPWRIALRNRYQRARRYSESAPIASRSYNKSGSKKMGRLKARKPKMKSARARVKSGATSVVFEIKSKSTIASDGSIHKVVITNHKIDAKFQYSTVPKLAPYAYLKAKMKNSSEYPFLAGKANVFLDNSFVAHSVMKSVAPGEKFSVFLGADEGVRVEYKFVKRYQTQEGVFSKSKVFTYEYAIKVKNNKKSDIDLVVLDQLPISSNENLLVKLLAPVIKEGSKNPKINKQKFIEWNVKPKSGEALSIPFRFSVKYPVSKTSVISDPQFNVIK